jgi:polyisoprenoid-binding protein YceI
VGRTTGVTGGFTLTLNGDGSGSAANVKVQADLAQLQSDSRRRDGFVSRDTLETDRYPNAVFTGGDPVTVPKAVIDGAEGTITVAGQWEIHGQVKPASIDLKVRRDGDKVDVVGSYGFTWGDFGVRKPQVQSATVKGDPVIEFSLVLGHGATT